MTIDQSLQAYFNAQSLANQKALQELRACIIKIVPYATEMFNYKIPAYTLVEGGNREEQIMIAGYKNHVGLYPHPSTMAHFEEALMEFKCGKGSVQFPVNKPLPTTLIEEMIQYRLDILTPQS